LHFALDFTSWRIWSNIWVSTRKANVATVAGALSRLDIDSLKIQDKEVLTLISGSENNRISNIKSTIPMHTALIFKEQAKVQVLREKGLA
jgi:hypothetical protein